MFEVGFSEILLIFGIALLVLGPNRLPKLAADLGRWAGRARAMARQLRTQLEQEVNYDPLKDQPETTRTMQPASPTPVMAAPTVATAEPAAPALVEPTPVPAEPVAAAPTPAVPTVPTAPSVPTVPAAAAPAPSAVTTDPLLGTPDRTHEPEPR